MTAKRSATKGEFPTPPAILLDDEERKKLANDFDKKTGISTLTLRKIFEGKTRDQYPENVKKLLELIEGRIREGRRLSLRSWRAYAAIDEAMNVANNQINPTLIGKVLTQCKGMRAADIKKQFESWGLSTDTLFCTVKDSDGKDCEILNEETFWRVFVPLVKSVVTVRVAKMWNDRDNDPFFKFEPAEITEESMLAGDLLTKIFRTMTAQMGYKSVARQIIGQAAKYGKCLQFPSEAWYADWDVDEKGEKYVKKEGLRYNIPHPTRCAIDPNHRPSTINTDTGVEWALYWDLQRYGEMQANPLYYNLKDLPYGHNWADGNWYGGLTGLTTYFDQIYPCRMRPPFQYNVNWQTALEDSMNSRERAAATYAEAPSDTAVFRTVLFMKLSPKQWGLGEYEPMVWIRFTIASDCTIIHAEPLPYTPCVFYGYDTDENAIDSTGIALEAMPFQDLAGNILSHHMLAIKQNLMKIIPWDTDQLTPTQIREMENRGKSSAFIYWLPYSSSKAAMAQVDPSRMFTPITFPQQNTVELVTALNTVINILERILNMSAQEAGAVAGHEQTAEEIKVVTHHTSQRVQYSGSFIDDGVEAWKRQIYEASQAFMDRDFVVSVSGISKSGEKILRKMGFKLKPSGDKIITVEGDLSRLAVDAFVSQREGATRTNFAQIAAPMLQAVTTVASNQMLAEKVGADWIIGMLDRIARLSGAPRDFSIRVSPEQETMAQMKQMAESIQQMAEQIKQGAVQTAVQAVGEAVAPAIQQTQQAVKASSEENASQQQQLEQLQQGMEQLVAMIGSLQQSAQEPPMESGPGLVPEGVM